MLSDLAWLPQPPRDFRQQLAALGAAPQGEALVRLATHRLDETQLARLARMVGALAAPPAPLSALRLGLIGDGTLSLLGPAIIGSGVRHGLAIELVEGGYGTAVQDAVDANSALRRAAPDMVLLALDARLAGFEHAALGAGAAAERVDAAVQRVEMIAAALRPAMKGPLLVQTIAPPLDPLFGSFDRLEPGSVFAMVEAFNARLAALARAGTIVLVDVARLAQSIGLEQWESPGHWHSAKLGFSPHYVPAYADLVARVLGAIRGKAKKALVLDLDNTLWGGVIGDDGLEGIVLGQGSAMGEAFLAIHRLALDLRARGIVLAVCSKNEDDAARLPFREHSEMLLREEHIAVFQANWTDKASNLRAIAATLNIGVDALVFLDDNPAEREQVRRELPLVGVPELPEDPALYPRMLAAAGYFEAIAFSDEDRNRADLYQSLAERAQLMANASDMESYLRALEMTCTIGPVDARNRARVAQLINKSNQFNLTTRRYTEAEVAAAEADPARHLAQIRLVDRFGDHGLISVLIADKGSDAWVIDTWLMSCRVLGRRVQEAALAHLAAAARAAGARALIGQFIPSAKNKMVAEHYAGLGFAADGVLDNGTTRWRLDLGSYQPPELPMRIDDLALTPERVAA